MFELGTSLQRGTLTMVLAGGQGERLYPLTRDRAKPAVPFGGLYRIIDFPLSNCLNSGLRKIVVLTQYKSLSLERHLRSGWEIFNSELGEYITIISPQRRRGGSWYVGTADAIYQNIYTLEQERPERVLVLAGDHVYAMDYTRMLQYHEDKRADATISCIRFARDRAASFGVVGADASKRVIRFAEKPADPEPVSDNPDQTYVSMGIYVFNTQALVRHVSDDARRDTIHDFGRDIIPDMISRGARVYAWDFEDENDKEHPYWRDIGQLDAYYEANMDLVQVHPEFNLYNERWPVRTYQPSFPPAKTVFDDDDRRGQAIDSIVCGGCIISGGRVARSVLSPGVRINSFSLVEDSILMEGVNVGRGARIRRAIIEKGVHIDEELEIGCDPEADAARFTVTENGVTIVPKGQMISD